MAPPGIPESAALRQGLRQAKDRPDVQWVLDAMLLGGLRTFFGSQVAMQVSQ